MTSPTLTIGQKIATGFATPAFLVVVVLGAALLYGLNGFVLFKLWQWYVPYGTPQFAPCVGLVLISHLLMADWQNGKILPEKPSTASSLVGSFLKPFYFLLMGWLGTFVMPLTSASDIIPIIILVLFAVLAAFMYMGFVEAAYQKCVRLQLWWRQWRNPNPSTRSNPQ